MTHYEAEMSEIEHIGSIIVRVMAELEERQASLAGIAIDDPESC